jgi:hypothetical protein
LKTPATNTGFTLAGVSFFKSSVFILLIVKGFD